MKAGSGASTFRQATHRRGWDGSKRGRALRDRARRMRCCQTAKNTPQGLKPNVYAPSAARLKPCPFKTRVRKPVPGSSATCRESERQPQILRSPRRPQDDKVVECATSGWQIKRECSPAHAKLGRGTLIPWVGGPAFPPFRQRACERMGQRKNKTSFTTPKRDLLLDAKSERRCRVHSLARVQGCCREIRLVRRIGKMLRLEAQAFVLGVFNSVAASH